MIRLLFCCSILAISACAPLAAPKSRQQKFTPADIREQQTERTKQFNTLVGRGIIEFHWSDEDGKHRSQGDFDFWKFEHEISLRISKSGEPLMWIGCDETNHWMFDMLRDETTLTINQEDIIFSNALDMLVLLGLAPLPSGTTSVDQGVVTVQTNKDVWVATFDPSTHRPLEIAIQSDTHHALALHRSGIKVELPQKTRLVWPVTGKLIDIESTKSNARVKIDFAWLSIDTSDQPMNRVFDLDFLRRSIKPTVVKGIMQ
jgi:hypothetical protein